jgi:YggT family protein
VSVQIVQIVRAAFEVMTWLIIGRVLLSWFRHNPHNPLIKFVYEITEPVLAPFRRIIPMVGAIDFSPIVAIIALRLLETLILGILIKI